MNDLETFTRLQIQQFNASASRPLRQDGHGGTRPQFDQPRRHSRCVGSARTGTSGCPLSTSTTRRPCSGNAGRATASANHTASSRGARAGARSARRRGSPASVRCGTSREPRAGNACRAFMSTAGPNSGGGAPAATSGRRPRQASAARGAGARCVRGRRGGRKGEHPAVLGLLPPRGILPPREYPPRVILLLVPRLLVLKG